MLAARGLPPPAVDLFMGLHIGARNGEWSAVDPALEDLLGRPRRTMRDRLAERIAT